MKGAASSSGAVEVEEMTLCASENNEAASSWSSVDARDETEAGYLWDDSDGENAFRFSAVRGAKPAS